MRKSLPIKSRIKTASQLVIRTRVFYDIWLFLDGEETRPAISDTIDKFSWFFVFDTHVHFVAFVVHIAALYENRPDTINLPQLAKEMKKKKDLISAQDAGEVDKLLGMARPLVKKVAILRNKLFAHRNDAFPYADIFKKADVTPDELRELTDIALKVANRLLIAHGLDDAEFNTFPREQLGDMFKALSKRTDGKTPPNI